MKLEDLQKRIATLKNLQSKLKDQGEKADEIEKANGEFLNNENKTLKEGQELLEQNFAQHDNLQEIVDELMSLLPDDFDKNSPELMKIQSLMDKFPKRPDGK